ncbi:Dolichyl-diphosphooligosaccharide--glycosyltransferase subunit STT3B [Olea europaea subsp. europaea]|uniref:dolichyl-diphosphooligosaccharide--protein glycotransferase n=1 Tax=Olea europaea subsp. europaea TaxID=158383 RepID=A0A8S0V0M7_OLEEU|nr:Dolichyl-diphosphooligosaccharide--glycosyltransferase subunit STT3B [Olea europaea subsp. europaea]
MESFVHIGGSGPEPSLVKPQGHIKTRESIARRKSPASIPVAILDLQYGSTSKQEGYVLSGITLSGIHDAGVLEASFRQHWLKEGIFAVLFTTLDDCGPGLVAVVLIVISPGYISRLVASSHDNEGFAKFAPLLNFYLFVKAVNTGSLAWAMASALGYFFIFLAWRG